MERLRDYDDSEIVEAAQRASNIIHHNFGGVKVENLAGNIAGQQDMTKTSVEGGMKIDVDFIKNETRERITHVLVHEGLHLRHAQKSRGERVTDIRYEEAFTELGAAQKTNQTPIAYQEHISYVRGKLQSTGVSESEMILAYAEGNAARINEVIAQAEGTEESLALSA